MTTRLLSSANDAADRLVVALVSAHAHASDAAVDHADTL
jgi:hypothetical protein